MRDHEWDLIEPGDALDYLPSPTAENPDPRPIRYQVMRLEAGTGCVIAGRVLGSRDDGVAEFATVETARIVRNSERWRYVSCKAKVVATGGFSVTRAETGEVEYQRCPTPRDRAKARRT